MNKIFITGSSYFVDKNIKDNLSDDEDASLEIFFGDELDKTEFFSYINSIDLFGSEKYAVLRNAGKIKDLEALVTAMAKTTECNLIISDVAKDKIDQQAIKLFKNNGFSVIAEEQKKTRATIDDVIQIFKAKKILLNYNQAELIFNKCFNNLSMVEHEADKMEIYILTKKENVPVNVLLEEVSGEKEETIFAPPPPPAFAVKSPNPIIFAKPPFVPLIVVPELPNVPIFVCPLSPKFSVTVAFAFNFATNCNVPPTPPWA